MAKRKPPRIKLWRGNYTLFYFDHGTGREVRKSCASLGAHDAKQRKVLLDRYLQKETLGKAEAFKRGGAVLAYDSLLVDELRDFLADVDRRVEVRKANPDARVGLAPGTAREYHDCVGRIVAWLEAKGKGRLTTGQVGPDTFKQYFDELAATPSPATGRVLSASRIAGHRRHVRVAVNWIAERRPARFPDERALAKGFKGVSSAPAKALAYTPDELARFARAALRYDDPERKANIVRTRGNGDTQHFEQEPPRAAVPVLRLFLLCALTGARLGEVLSLRWSHCDLERGRLFITASKTGRERIVPLVNAPEAEIAPGLLALLRQWKLEAGDREFVLPFNGARIPHSKRDDNGEPINGEPVFPKGAWRTVNRWAESEINPQGLRKSFVSYCRSLGIPATSAAHWSGHGLDVATKHYDLQVLERIPDATSIEAAMGLDGAIRRILHGEQQGAANEIAAS